MRGLHALAMRARRWACWRRCWACASYTTTAPPRCAQPQLGHLRTLGEQSDSGLVCQAPLACAMGGFVLALHMQMNTCRPSRQ